MRGGDDFAIFDRLIWQVETVKPHPTAHSEQVANASIIHLLITT